MPVEPVSPEFANSHAFRNASLAIGLAIVTGPALVTYALVKGSGSTVAELGGDIWRSTADRRSRMLSAFQGIGEIAMDYGRDKLDGIKAFSDRDSSSIPAGIHQTAQVADAGYHPGSSNGYDGRKW